METYGATEHAKVVQVTEKPDGTVAGTKSSTGSWVCTSPPR